MSKPMITIHNSETGKIEIREMNDAEFAQWQLDQSVLAIELVNEAKKESQKAQLLTKLGITADEAKLLLE